jgi:two-component system, chemotaxis family, response regulator Rcp1
MDVLEILLVEDNPGDVRLVQEAFKESKLSYHLNVVSDGTDALTLLKKVESNSPNAILLDLNLPGKNGLEILDEIKADHQLKDIPIIVLTSSDRDLDVLVAYKRKASAYLIKPSNLSQFDEVIDAIVTLCY